MIYAVNGLDARETLILGATAAAQLGQVLMRYEHAQVGLIELFAVISLMKVSLLHEDS